LGEREGFVRKAIALLVLALAPVAGAQLKGSLSIRGEPTSVQRAGLSVTAVSADPNSMGLAIDIGGAPSMDALGDLSNWVHLEDVGGLTGWGNDAVVDGVGWSLSIQTVGASWLSEAAIYLDDAVDPDESGVIFTPGTGDFAAGTGTYASGGMLDLTDNGIADVPLPDGLLRIETFEHSDNYPDAMDAEYLNGATLYVSVHPEPATIVLLALGIAGVGTRRRPPR